MSKHEPPKEAGALSEAGLREWIEAGFGHLGRSEQEDAVEGLLSLLQDDGEKALLDFLDRLHQTPNLLDAWMF